jgi:hypothetical protein
MTNRKLIDALRACAAFIENVSDETPDRTERFFACREQWRAALRGADATRYAVTEGELVRLFHDRPEYAGDDAVKMLARDALDVAAAYVQAALGVTSGDLASRMLGGAEASLVAYVRAELREQLPYATGRVGDARTVARHATLADAERWIADQAKTDAAGVLRGDYFLDAPEPAARESTAWTFQPRGYGRGAWIERGAERWNVHETPADIREAFASEATLGALRAWLQWNDPNGDYDPDSEFPYDDADDATTGETVDAFRAMVREQWRGD